MGMGMELWLWFMRMRGCVDELCVACVRTFVMRF